MFEYLHESTPPVGVVVQDQPPPPADLFDARLGG
jgi:hypothetical protein